MNLMFCIRQSKWMAYNRFYGLYIPTGITLYGAMFRTVHLESK